MSRVVIVGGVVLILGLAIFLLVRPGPAGELGDDIAGALNCTGEKEITEESNTVELGDPEVFKITCATGYVNPTATLYRFETREDLLASFQGGAVGERRMCLTEREAFDNSFHPFEEFCRDHGGEVRCGPACEKNRARTNTPPVKPKS